jgi:hypothetical protein
MCTGIIFLLCRLSDDFVTNFGTNSEEVEWGDGLSGEAPLPMARDGAADATLVGPRRAA